MTADALPLLPDHTFTRVLCVVAHPDDMEYGSSAAVAKWVAQGIEVGYLLLTRGEAGMPNPPEETAAIRRKEQEAACGTVGVTRLTMLDHPDGVLVYNLDLRRDIAREIRTFHPDAVVVTPFDVEAPWGLNQADHRAAGLAAVDAVRDAGNRWVFPELSQEPWSARWILVSGDARPTHGVPVTAAHVEKSVASLEAHREYLAALPWHPLPSDMIPQITKGSGNAIGAEYAVLFRAYDLSG